MSKVLSARLLLVTCYLRTLFRTVCVSINESPFSCKQNLKVGSWKAFDEYNHSNGDVCVDVEDTSSSC